MIWCEVMGHDTSYRPSREPHVKPFFEVISLMNARKGHYLGQMFREWIKLRLRTLGKNSGDLATAINRDRAVVSRIMNGRQKLTLDQAKQFATVLNCELTEVLEKSGVADRPTAQQLTPGFAESDAVIWSAEGGHKAIELKSVAASFGGARDGVDVWRVKGMALALAGFLPGDWMLVDRMKAERVRAGDVVIAKIYNNSSGAVSAVLRRFEPPVLVAASPDAADQRVFVVDGMNVVIQGKVIAQWRELDG